MSRTYVALDLETTGLDPDQETIIEVGAVRFGEASAEETFHAVVNPRRPLPYRIQLLTGITPQDLEGAPFFAEVASELESFIGSHPVVGHNVAFDLGFLARQGIVPRDYLIGKACFVYWPAAYRLNEGFRFPFIPNVGDMRFIR